MMDRSGQWPLFLSTAQVKYGLSWVKVFGLLRSWLHLKRRMVSCCLQNHNSVRQEEKSDGGQKRGPEIWDAQSIFSAGTQNRDTHETISGQRVCVPRGHLSVMLTDSEGPSLVFQLYVWEKSFPRDALKHISSWSLNKLKIKIWSFYLVVRPSADHLSVLLIFSRNVLPIHV